jgi:hypothetical protein
LTEDQENLQYEEDEETKITRRTQMALSIWI